MNNYLYKKVFFYNLTLSHNTSVTECRRRTNDDGQTDHRRKPYHELDCYL